MKDGNDFTIYSLRINRYNGNPMSIMDGLVDFMSEMNFADAMTFVWIANPKNASIIVRLMNQRDDNGNKGLVKHKDNMYFMYNRPVFFDANVPEDTILFRSYV